MAFTYTNCLFMFPYTRQLLAQLVNCDWWEVTFQMKAEQKSVLTMCGALCVMTTGAVLMLLWCVDNQDTPLKVRHFFKVNVKCDFCCRASLHDIEIEVHQPDSTKKSHKIGCFDLFQCLVQGSEGFEDHFHLFDFKYIGISPSHIVIGFFRLVFSLLVCSDSDVMWVAIGYEIMSLSSTCLS